MITAHIELNIADVMEAIEKHLAEKHPDVQVTGVTVRSWNYVVFHVVGDKMELPVAHIVRPGHKLL